MARCPCCGEDINGVYLTEKMYVTYMAYVSDNNSVEYEVKQSEPSEDDEIFVVCPVCDAVFPLTSERDVERFLRGDIVLASSEDVEERGNYAIFDNDVFKIADKSGNILILERVDDDNISKIILKSEV